MKPARVFVTGSADGLGLGAARALLADGHQVVLHVRNEQRRSGARELLDRGAECVLGDLSDQEETIEVAAQVNRLGRMDAVIHNAGVYSSGPIVPVNVIAPYLLTALITRPHRLIFLSSGMHQGGRPAWNASGSYSDSKLMVTTLAAAIARRWPEVITSSVDPGWVPTKMGGPNAPDDLRLGHLTQVWLATSHEPEALVSGGYWHHQRRLDAHPATGDPAFQKELLDQLERATRVPLPE